MKISKVDKNDTKNENNIKFNDKTTSNFGTKP